ncbi:Cytoplasmic dynein 1 intermediate chain [Caligus rogercresseyi]|uniref:Cytoplasmic dynein 1 intermediate chain n=1 Tax=Caligus rogercresseyi TaxID=217165 RepID=A0A7T8JTC1_CALRO|nr:Cytoplasmic dynein 1 intermediate chain [Caligus rogercresseyi]QQP33095.1 Cytoplasmic dynein 1 intermediate chain [Caligus rogercresseyi]
MESMGSLSAVSEDSLLLLGSEEGSRKSLSPASARKMKKRPVLSVVNVQSTNIPPKESVTYAKGKDLFE